jgi:hypothetical protein
VVCLLAWLDPPGQYAEHASKGACKTGMQRCCNNHLEVRDVGAGDLACAQQVTHLDRAGRAYNSLMSTVHHKTDKLRHVSPS